MNTTLKIWWKPVVICIIGQFVSCNSTIPVIGFIPTDPASITSNGLSVGPMFLNVSEVADTMSLSAQGHPTYHVLEVKRTVEHALSKAFSTTTQLVLPDDHEQHTYELRLILLTSNYKPMGYYSTATQNDNPFSFGPRPTATNRVYRPYSIDTQYKASLYASDKLVAVFEGVINSPGVWGMETNLKKAMESVAEHLNTDVVQFLLKQKGE